MARQTICDCCGKVIKEPFADYRGDINPDCLIVLEVKPISINSTKGIVHDPDLCRGCIINTLRG